ncbi:MAG: limA 1 [Nocardioides sp.]|nr:limA 1 [Nocardioides sp.]
MSQPQDPAAVVRTCLEALQAADTTAALDLLDPRLEWRNSGLPTLRGRRAHAAFSSLERAGIGFEVVFHHLAVDGEVVLTERTDVLVVGGVRTEFWVCGTFIVREGRIVLWDDHFSMRNVLAGAATGLLRAAPAVLRRGR